MLDDIELQLKNFISLGCLDHETLRVGFLDLTIQSPGYSVQAGSGGRGKGKVPEVLNR
jgi:hypothetical protein